MKKIALTALVALTALIAHPATLKIQNSSDHSVRVWLYNQEKKLINTWVVDTTTPKVVNSHVQGIGSITWARVKDIPSKEQMSALPFNRRASHTSTYIAHLNMKPLSLGHRFFIFKQGAYKYQPSKDTVISERARRLSEVEE